MMDDKTCSSCIDNDDGICDRKGTMVEEDDTCEKWKGKNLPDWRARVLNTFLSGH